MAACGTDAGYQAHRRRSEDACDRCLDAHRAYVRASQQIRRRDDAVRRAERLRRQALSELRRRHLIEYDQILADLTTNERTT